MIGRLRLPRETFRELGMTAAGPDGLAMLRAIHRNRQYLLLRMVIDRLPAGARTGGVVKGALELLAHVQRQNRSAFEAVLMYPHVGAGLVRCSRELNTTGDVRSAGRYLATVAAAAAFRAGLDFDLGVTPTAALHLPAMGTAHVGASLPEIRMRQHNGRRTIGPVTLPEQPGDESAGWSAVRWFDTKAMADAGFDVDIALDDLDPDRGAGGLLPAGRLSPREFAIWHDAFSLACTRLDTTHPVWAAQVRHVVRAVTPLARPRRSHGRSASTWQAYGAVALTLPTDDLAMASTFVHEVQHSTLNAVMTAVDLYDREDSSRHYSPWRADPRPLHGLLHGCYAFLGVAAFWSAERAAGTGRRADYEFARAALQVREALDTLAGVQGLTQEGREFVACMAERLEALPATPMPDPVRHLAELAVDDHRMSWRLRSVVLHPPEVSAIAAAWCAGRPVSSLPVATELAAAEETFIPNERIRLWSTLARQPILHGDDPDLLLAQQVPEAAAQRYVDAVRHDPESTAAWAGLAMAAARMNGPARQLWRCRPELVRAVHRAVRDRGCCEPPDPLTLARWLATG